MVWVKIDDKAATHPKTTAGGLDTFGLWVAGLCHCNLHTTGGKIPKTALKSLLPSDRVKTRVLKRCARELVETGRWIDRDDHWEVHGYGVEQAHALQQALEKRREDDAKRQRKHREAVEKRREDDEKRTRSEREASRSAREASARVERFRARS